jgi:HK97 family phage major capsid protein
MDLVQKKRADLKTLLDELQAYQTDIAGKGESDQNRAEAMDAKAAEAEELQAWLKDYDAQHKRLTAIQDAGGFDPGLPPDHQPDHDPVDDVLKADMAAGFMRIGDYVAALGTIQKWVEAGRPNHFLLANVPTFLPKRGHGEPLVALTKTQITGLVETKAVPTIGANVIEPTRLPEMVRVTEHDMLRIRDVLNVSSTGSNAVEWTRLVNYTRAADPTAAGALKPEADLQLDAVSTPVRTVAVWMPVQNQQLEDLPQLQNIINVEMLYDLDKRLEELVCWGTGVGQEFQGFFNDPLIWACGQMTAAGATRVVGADTLVDIVRRGITDVRVAGYQPNGVLLHPYDWETIVLLKATTNEYIWSVVTEGNVSRLWTIPVIETVACEDFAGNATEERNLLVGDFRRGATLWDRHQSQISVGWQNTQFVQNMRTILAEFRAAFAVRRPGAFRDYQTQAAVAS